MRKKFLVNCITQVNAAAIQRVTENGDEYIVVPSYTLPDDVVMNGGLYPADEIAKSYTTLNGTHAPVEHPQDKNGQYILCSSPAAMINGYLVGVENRNAKKDGNRVSCEKWVHVRTALNSERGKRLLDRINALMNGQGEPIHTSTGLLLEREELAEPITNEAGQSYSWIARNMLFDHDAILLDSPGAATPEQGVGIGVNSDGQPIDRLVCFNGERIELDDGMRDEISEWEALRRNVRDAIHTMLGGGDTWVYIEDLNKSAVVYEHQGGQFMATYSRDDSGTVAVQPLPHDKVQAVTLWERIVNALRNVTGAGYNKTDEKVNTKEDQEMREDIIAALSAAGVATDGLSNAQLLAEYNKQATAPLQEQLTAINARLDQQDKAERDALVQQIGDKAGLSANTLQSLPLGELKALAANTATVTRGINTNHNAPADKPAGCVMPE